jgi:peroxiredoxin
MKIERNRTAPVFSLVDVFGRTIDLSAYADKRILLGFFRHAGCPFCNLRVHALSKLNEELKEHMAMIFFFESKESVILRSTFHREVSPIPILSDPNKTWYAAYGLEPSTSKSTISHFTSFVQTVIRAKAAGVPVHMMASGESFATMPAEFLIDKGLIVRDAYYSERLNDRRDLDLIREFARKGTIPL